MTGGLADTSLFIAHETGRPLRTEVLPDRIAVSVLTVAELRAGVLAAPDVATRDRRLGALTAALVLDPIPVDEAVVRRGRGCGSSCAIGACGCQSTDPGSRPRPSRWGSWS